MSNKAEPQNVLTTIFCDNSNTISTFHDTSFGKLTAMDEFRKMCKKGEENDSIWGVTPHVSLVRLELATSDPAMLTKAAAVSDTKAEMQFTCSCKKAALHG